MDREFLTHSGFRTLDAHDGRQALASVLEMPPGAVFADRAVPAFDGVACCRSRRAHPRPRFIPILAVTGHCEYVDQTARLRQAGIEEIPTRPCPPDVIADSRRRLLRGASGADPR